MHDKQPMSYGNTPDSKHEAFASHALPLEVRWFVARSHRDDLQVVEENFEIAHLPFALEFHPLEIAEERPQRRIRHLTRHGPGCYRKFAFAITSLILASRVPRPASRIPGPGSRVPGPASRIPGPASRVPRPAARAPRPAARLPRPAPRLDGVAIRCAPA